MDAYQIYAIYLLVLSLITFIFYFVDKVKAKAKAWRVPEKTLLGLSLLGGAFGGGLAMLAFRHKTKHWYFGFINILGIIIHLTGIVIVYLKF